MTAEIIPFPKKNNPSTINSGWDYLQLCKQNLIFEDYIDILLAIMDPDHYFEIEEQLQEIVDSYFDLERIYGR